MKSIFSRLLMGAVAIGCFVNGATAKADQRETVGTHQCVCVLLDGASVLLIKNLISGDYQTMGPFVGAHGVPNMKQCEVAQASESRCAVNDMSSLSGDL